MKMDLSSVEGRVLHGLVEEASGDVVIRLDARGFIVHASQNSGQLGVDLSNLLLMPHISDLAERGYDEAVSAFVAKVFAGEVQSGWCEFPIALSQPEDTDCPPAARRWFALSLRLIEEADEEGAASRPCALGLLRSVQHRHQLAERIHAGAVTEPLTGLANRRAFCAGLARELESGAASFMAVFAVDSMRALFMQYGQQAADEIAWGFAKFLENLAPEDTELAQLDSERFALVLPGMNAKAARDWAEDVVRTFASVALPASSRAPQLTASAGLAPIEVSVDWTLRQAELALVIARAGGGMRVSETGYHPGLATPPVGVAASAR